MRSLGTNDVHVVRGVEDGKAYARAEQCGDGEGPHADSAAACRTGAVVSAKASEEMLAILRSQKFNEGIPAGLPASTPVAHKTGSFTKVYHDVGIVEPPGKKPFQRVSPDRLGP